jgi:hypothetical protein
VLYYSNYKTQQDATPHIIVYRRILYGNLPKAYFPMIKRFICYIALLCTISSPLSAQKIDSNRTIDLSEEKIPLKMLLEKVFWNMGYAAVIIDKNLPNPDVTIQGMNLKASDILRFILAKYPVPLTYQAENGICIVKSRINVSNNKPLSKEAQANYAIISLKNRNAFDIGRLFQAITISKLPIMLTNKSEDEKRGRNFSPAGITNIFALENNTLLVEGDSQGIAELKELIQQLDIPSKSVECEVEITRIVRHGKKTEQSTFITSGSGLEWTDIEVMDVIKGSAEKQRSIKVDLRVLPLGNGSYEVESAWNISLPLVGKKQDLQRFEKDFHSTRQYAPGERTIVSRTVQKNEEEETEIQCCLTVKPHTK